jgi:hypothetical protein
MAARNLHRFLIRPQPWAATIYWGNARLCCNQEAPQEPYFGNLILFYKQEAALPLLGMDNRTL